MKLSICVCAYNAQDTIERCLSSLLDQSISDYEIVVINDGSKDDTEIIVSKMAEKDSRIRFYSQSNRGVAISRNRAIQVSRGDYITFVDSDDWVESDSYSKVMTKVNEGYDIVVYDSYKFNKDTKYEFNMVHADEGRITPQQYYTSVPCPWNKVVRRDLFIKHELFFPEHIIYEDYAMIPNLAKTTDKIYYLKHRVVNYDITQDSITRGKKYKEKAIDILEASQYLYDKTDKEQFNIELQEMFYEHILVSSCRYFIAYDRIDLANAAGSFVKRYFPDILKNLNISLKNKFIAWCFLNQKAHVVKWLVMRKKGVHHEA